MNVVDLRSCEYFFLPVNPACTTSTTSSTSTTTTSTTSIPTTTTTSTSTTSSTTTTSTTLCECYEGYTPIIDGLGCIKTSIIEASPPTNIQTSIPKTYSQYSMLGSILFNPGYNINGTTGAGYQMLTNSMWKNIPQNLTDGPLNRCGLWTTTSMNNQDVGFTKCITLNASKTYYIAVACDNYSIIRIDGNVVVQQDSVALAAQFGAGASVTFRYWFIYPVVLTKGSHAVEMIGHNVTSIAALGAEIYDATKYQIIQATNYSTFYSNHIIFTTKDMRGQNIQIGTGGFGYTCPSGYSLINCDGSPYCISKSYIDCGEIPPSTTTTSTSTSTTTTSTTILPTTTTTTTTEVPSLMCGLLYNWYAASDREIAPEGWHVPTLTEMQTLSTYLGGNSISGGKLKEAGTSHWVPNVGGTNSSGFTALPSGFRMGIMFGSFQGIYDIFYCWSISGDEEGQSMSMQLLDSEYYTEFLLAPWSTGLSLRLIKDDDVDPHTVTDFDGNVYDTIKIGNQVWTAQNYRCLHFNNGDLIPFFGIYTNYMYIDSEWAGLTSAAVCAYNNDWTASCVTIPNIIATTTTTRLTTTTTTRLTTTTTTRPTTTTSTTRLTTTTTTRPTTTTTTTLTPIPWTTTTTTSSTIAPQIYGQLYNWYAAANSKLPKAGWHVPLANEWFALGVALGGNGIWPSVYGAGRQLKSVGNLTDGTGLWMKSPNPNTEGTNTSGMTANPAGIVNNLGVPGSRTSDANFWCKDEETASLGRYFNLNYSSTTLFRGDGYYNKHYGFSIRLVKDAATPWNPGDLYTDYDGNTYNTAMMADGKVWTIQNLRVQHYNDGVLIPTNPSDWSSRITGAIHTY